MLHPTGDGPKSKATRPAKPYPDFPLYAHSTRRWAKKIRGKLYYFGPWSDPDGALKKYLDQKDDLYAGRQPRARGEEGEGVTVRDAVNHFLTSKKHLVDSGEIIQRTFLEYYSTCERIIKAFGATRLLSDLGAADFESLRATLAKRWGPVTLSNEVQRIRSVFKFADDEDLIDKPVRVGTSFKRPSRKVLRKARAEKGLRMFEAKQLHTVLKAASVQLRAMILLGVNCGFGNADVGTLPLTALDIERGWVNYPRPKTGIERRCPLWPETVAALQQVLVARQVAKDEADRELVFLTKYRQRWFTGTMSNPLSHEMTKLLRALGIHRPGLNFYALRHTFETIAGEAKDQVVVDAIMGHLREDMASVYRERISDSRLKYVSDFVRSWLFGQSTLPTVAPTP